jgi:hypothetical protein
MEVFNKFFNYLPLGPLVGVLSRHDRVGNLGPAMGTIGTKYRHRVFVPGRQPMQLGYSILDSLPGIDSSPHSRT